MIKDLYKAVKEEGVANVVRDIADYIRFEIDSYLSQRQANKRGGVESRRLQEIFAKRSPTYARGLAISDSLRSFNEKTLAVIMLSLLAVGGAYVYENMTHIPDSPAVIEKLDDRVNRGFR